MINNNRQGSIAPVVIAVVSAAIIILFLLGWYPKTWFNNLFGGSDKLALIGSFGDFKEGGSIDDAAKTIVADLISAQSNSKTENTKWGGCFRNPAGGSDFYDIVSNILVSPDDACTIGGSVIHKANNNLPNGIEFLLPESGKFISVVFNVNGTTNSNKDIILEISNGIDHRYIIITPLGFITYGLTTDATPPAAPAPSPNPAPAPTPTTVNRTRVIKPTAPAIVNVSNGNGAVTISWNPPVFDGNAPILQYRVYRSFVSNGVRSVAGTTGPNTLSFTDSGLLNGANYFYHVTAFNFLFESPESAEVAGSPTGPTYTVAPQPQCPSGYTGAYPNCYPPQQTISVPSAPTNLNASGRQNYISLSWDTPSSNGSQIVNYRIYRSNTSSGPSYITTVNGTSYNDVGLPNSATYYYWVSAVNSAGEGNLSNRDSATTYGNQSNQCPNGYSGTYPNCYQNQQCPGGYTGTYPNCYPAQQQCSSGYAGTYPNCYPIQQQSSVPGAPTLYVTGGQRQITLNYSVSNQGSSAVTSYNIYRGTSANGAYPYLTNTSNTSSFIDFIPTDNTTYYYAVKAVNSVGEGYYFSNYASGTTTSGSNNNPPPQQNYAPSTPQNVQTSRSASTASITVSWNTSNGATSYKVRRGISPNSPNQTFTASSNSFTDNNLDYNTTYYYSVSAVNSYGESNYSTPEVWQTTINAPSNNNNPPPQQTYAPSAPQNVGAYGNSSNPTVNVYWNASSGATSYKLLRATSPNSPSRTVLSVGNVTSYADQNLSYNTTYYYVVVATNSSGESNYSTPEVWVTTMSAPSNNNNPPPQQTTNAPATPSGLSIYHTGNSVTFSWYSSNGATSYRVRRGTSPNNPTVTFEPGNVTSFTDNNLSYNTTYYYSVAAVNSGGQSAYSHDEAWTTTSMQ